MSYTRRFKKTIRVYYSGSVSYPPSQNGGRTSYSGTVNEEVIFDVTVDTNPFDNEVGNVKNQVDLLTGSVAATEAAHVGVIHETSKQIGDTIVAGFFKTVKSDISQQIAQLKTRAESLLLQMNKLADRCRNKKKQMGVDYQRISERYSKIFSDLNNELENRIYSIDEPVFHVTRSLDAIGSLSGSNDMVSTVSVSAGENAHVHSMIAANIAKKQAIEAIENGRRFLSVQYATDKVINKCLMSNRETGTLSTPFCVMYATSDNGGEREVYTSPLIDDASHDSLSAKLDEVGWGGEVREDDQKAIRDYYNQCLDEERARAKNHHDVRVCELMGRLFNLSQTAVPGK